MSKKPHSHVSENRRTVIKAIGASAAVFGGFSQSAGASNNSPSAEEIGILDEVREYIL